MTSSNAGNQGDATAAERSADAATREYKSRDERRAEIVDATLAILMEQGLHAWTTAALARRVGVSEATLFRHFRDKDEILAEALRQQIRRLRERIDGYEPRGTAWERVEGLLDHVLRFIEETGGGPLIILSGQALRILPAVRDDVEATRRTFRDRLERLFADLLDQAGPGRPGGADRPRPDPSALADLSVATVQSSGLRWMISGQRASLREIALPMIGCLGTLLTAREEGER